MEEYVKEFIHNPAGAERLKKSLEKQIAEHLADNKGHSVKLMSTFVVNNNIEHALLILEKPE